MTGGLAAAEAAFVVVGVVAGQMCVSRVATYDCDIAYDATPENAETWPNEGVRSGFTRAVFEREQSLTIGTRAGEIDRLRRIDDTCAYAEALAPSTTLRSHRRARGDQRTRRACHPGSRRKTPRSVAFPPRKKPHVRPRMCPVVQIRKTFRFEAAHVLPHHPGKCARLHGHSYRFEVAVRGPLRGDGPARGMVVDFDDLARIVRPAVVDVLDHSSLNDLLPNPTAEEIALWIWEALAGRLPQLDEIVLWETQTACAVVREADARAR